LADKVSEIRKNYLLLKKEPYGVHFSEQASDQCPGLIIGFLKQKVGIYGHDFMQILKNKEEK